jgi:hypothetical protein
VAQRMSEHSPTGGSGSERWINCPGSIRMIAALPAKKPTGKSSTYPTAGLFAHRVAAACLNTGRDAYTFVLPENKTFRPKDAEAVQNYIDYTLVRRALLQERYDRVELRVEIRIGGEGDFRGTVDAYILCYEGDVAVFAEVIDYKHGTGVAVPVENNTQLMYYGVGVHRLHPSIKTLLLTIVQPRIPGYTASWEISGKDLISWATKVLYPAIIETKKKDAALKAGTWCRFCPANEQCSTFEEAGGKASLPPLFIRKEVASELWD